MRKEKAVKVVIIEDDPEVVEAVSLGFDLRWPDASVIPANTGLIGIDLVKEESPDIVILDIGLPDIDGFEVCRQIRLFSNVPIVMLTATGKEFNKVKGLEMGADDYITKPFSYSEFLARIKAVLRRTSIPANGHNDEFFTAGNLSIDFAEREVQMKKERVQLTPTEYILLCLLAKNAGRVMPYQSLMEKIWGSDCPDEANNILKVYIQRLRAKLEDDPHKPQLIVLQRVVGYKLVKPD